jgi:hypothetical protein
MRLPMSSVLVVLAVLALVPGGCSSRKSATADGPTRESELRELASLLILHSGQHRRGPSKPADLAEYEAGGPLAYRAVQSGELVVVWGATMPGEGEGGGTDAVVAYEKKVPSEGGWVLLHNGNVKSMSAAEFQSAKKAGK